jgi:N-methylhydantoinase B/oxoprolinase/acetone carboxylase alpha subunit
MQTHMTNTRITDAEVLETLYPVRLIEFSRRPGSGGIGKYSGGDGLIREFEFLERVTVSLLTERRRHAPFGLYGAAPGATGQNLLNGKPLPGAAKFEAQPGDRLRVLTPGGGGYGRCDP